MTVKLLKKIVVLGLKRRCQQGIEYERKQEAGCLFHCLEAWFFLIYQGTE